MRKEAVEGRSKLIEGFPYVLVERNTMPYLRKVYEEIGKRSHEEREKGIGIILCSL